MYKRKIGLDIGSKSCGIALSDPLNITAQGKENYRFEEYDWDALIEKVKDYFSKFVIDTIVIGYPTLPSGDKSQTTLMIEEVEEIIKENFDVPVIRIAEDFTTKRAHEIMIKTGLTREKRKKYKDQIAAQLILMDYLSTL